jgi:hypothetical protein
MSSSHPTVTPDAAFRTTLQRFDVVPTLTGLHDGVDNSTVLTDTARGGALPAFPDAFGLTVSQGDLMTTMLHNLEDGSSCTTFFVTDDATLTCAEFHTDGTPISSTLQGGYGIEDSSPHTVTGSCSDGIDNGPDGLTDGADPDCDYNDWDAGDQYLIPGDPQALGTIVLQNLYDLAARMSNVTTGTWSTSQALPMIGLSPKELVPQFADVTLAIADINAGNTAVQISCLSEDGADFIDSAPLITETVYCSATVPISTPVTAVSWTVVNSTTISNETLTETVNTRAFTATEEMAFAADDYTGMQINVEVTDSEGIVRRGRLPEGPPLSLAELELDLESALGVPPEALTFEMIDLYNPTADDTLKHLVLRLGMDDEGQRDVRLRLDLPAVEDPDTNTPGSCSDGSDNGGDGDMDADDTDCADPLQVIGEGESDTLPLNYTSQVRLGTGVITGTHTEDFAVGGTHTDPISSTTTLTDTLHTGPGADNLDFKALPIRTGVTISNTTDGADCTVTTVTSDTLECAVQLGSSGKWNQGDVYTVTAPSATTLYDPSRDFTQWGIEPGDTVRNHPSSPSPIPALVPLTWRPLSPA